MKVTTRCGLILFCFLILSGFRGNNSATSYIKIYDRNFNKKYDNGCHLNISYPEIKSNRSISNYYVNKKIQGFASRTVNVFQGISEEFKPSSSDSYNYLSIEYKVLFSSSKFVSIRFNKTMKLIGAEKELNENKTLNYDLADNTIIKLSDILEDKSQAKLALAIQKYSGVIFPSSSITNTTQFGLEDKYLVLKLTRENEEESNLYKIPWYGIKDILQKKGIGFQLYEMGENY